MAKYIDAEKVIVALTDTLQYEGMVMDELISVVANIPAADVVERKTGKWKRTYLDHEAMGERPSIFYCSACNQCIAYPVNYCPSCGADMRGDDHEND